MAEFLNCNYKEDFLHKIWTQTGFLNGFSFKGKSGVTLILLTY